MDWRCCGSDRANATTTVVATIPAAPASANVTDVPAISSDIPATAAPAASPAADGCGKPGKRFGQGSAGSNLVDHGVDGGIGGCDGRPGREENQTHGEQAVSGCGSAR